MRRRYEALVSRKHLQVGLVVSLTLCSLLWQSCSAVPQSAASTPKTSEAHSGNVILPSSSVGANYRQPLFAETGGSFRLTNGRLPPGLRLEDASGTLLGVPMQAGAFTFTITTIDDLHPRTTFNDVAYSLTVHPVWNGIEVQISPASVSVAPGTKAQFSAVVKHTSNTGVNWSASAGKISSTGLWTAPTNTTGESIAITASSAADPNANASATVTLTSGAFTILTTSLPTGFSAIPYFASLAATGGQAPYSWSLASGSLPASLQLSSTGVLSGTPTKAGTYTFAVRGTDATLQSTQRSYSIVISNGGRECGPPSYGCSRTDSSVVQISHVPNVGNLSGANRVVVDPDFGNRIARISDWNTDPGLPNSDRSFVSAASGSADENLWNTDSTMFIMQALGAAGYPFTFDASTMQAQRMYVSNYSSRGGLTISGGGMWSRVSSNVLYSADDVTPTIKKYDLSDSSTPPSPQLVYDFRSSPNCLPVGFTQTWKTRGGLSADDTVLGMGYSDGGTQGTGVYAVAYKVGSGCTVLNTKTGQVWGDWGEKGTINIPDRWVIHNVKMSRDGKYLIVATAGCLSASCSNGPYFWKIGTTSITSCGDGINVGQRCSGHWTEGYSHWMNNYDAGRFTTRPLSDPTSIAYLTPNVPTGISDPLDQHASWNNADAADSNPIFLSFWSLTNPFPGPWYNEITGVAPDGSGKVWRFAHSFISARSQIFSTEYAIGSVSQDGRFFIFSSDWMGTLGSQAGGSTCTISTDCRGDVFVLELK